MKDEPIVSVPEPALISDNKTQEETPQTLVKKPSLAVLMARQNSEFYTDSEWPNITELTKEITYVLRRDGLYEIRKNSAGIFVSQREKFTHNLPGFTKEETKEGFFMNFGKIPYDLFQEILGFFKAICDESKDEVYVQTFWDPAAGVYFNYVPKQVVSGASVRYDRDIDLEKRCVLVLETHSHNTMNAFFSGTDNADEKADRFFGVIGELNKSTPAMLFSYVCGGKRVLIDMGGIFNIGASKDFSEWKSRVTRNITTSYTQHYTGSYYGSSGTGGMRDLPDYSSRSWSGQSDSRQKDFETGSQAALWRSERPRATTFAEREKEAAEEIKQAAKEIMEDMNRAEEDTGDVNSYFCGDQTTLFFKDEEDDQKLDIINEVTTLFKLRGETMSNIEKEAAFGRLMDSLNDENVEILAKVMFDFGYSSQMLSALDIDMVMNDDIAEAGQEAEV